VPVRSARPPEIRQIDDSPPVARRLPLFATARASASGEQTMVVKERVETVIDRVRPFLQADGGDLEVMGVEGDEVRVRLTGACAQCPQARITLQFGLEAALRSISPSLRVVRER
jgi:Fe-S cluster biogenesis protein NfuA